MFRCLLIVIILSISILSAAIEPIKIEMKVSFNGEMVKDTTLSLTFKLYPVDTGGVALWIEAHDTVSISKSGKFVVNLGEINPFPQFLNLDSKYWLGIVIDMEETERREISLNPKSNIQKGKTVKVSSKSSKSETGVETEDDSLLTPVEGQKAYSGSVGYVFLNGCWTPFYPEVPAYHTCYIFKDGKFVLVTSEGESEGSSDVVSGDSGFSVKINNGEDITIENGAEVNLKATISGGIPPYSYEWYEGQDMTVIGSDSLYSFTSDTTTNFRVKVIDANSDSTSAVVNVNVITTP